MMNIRCQIIAYSCALMLAGCTSQPPADSNVLIERPQLQADPEVNYFVTVTELLEERIAQPDGSTLLRVQFAVDARSDADLAWKVTWFDSNSMLVKSISEGYRRATLLTGQTRYFTVTAPHSRATRYQLHLREPQQ